IAGALSYFVIKVTDNSTGLKNSGLFSSQQVLLYANNTVGFRLTQAGIGITDTIYHDNDTDTKIRFPANDTIRFETAGSQRLNIAPNGNISITNDLDVDGHTNLDNVSIAGVTTFTGAIDANADLDVDGHTNLDNVSIAGVTTHNEDVWFKGATSSRDVYWDKSDDSLEFYDHAKATFGTNSKTSIYHSGTQFYINNTQGNIYLRNNNKNGVLIRPDSNVNLYYDNVIKLSTASSGINVVG
ncbi:MAG: hypothetical protein VXY93_15790, partial [Pseudomonadota bacterium]|nr:hypothetical protein [Pseudomonadota bacterium]